MPRSAHALRGPALALTALLGVSVAASVLALGLLNAAPLYPGLSRTGGGAATPRGRMLLIVIDGLGEETARTLPSLQRLARRGASARVLAEFPTFSAPAYVTLLSGTPPRSSGRRSNLNLFAAGVDSVPDRLSQEGRTARALSDEVDWWGRLFPHAFAQAEVVPTGELVARAERLMDVSELLLVHLCQVDEAGHDHGARSGEYADAARVADAQVAELVERWGSRGVVTVLSDHGHVPAGGHGGPEEVARRTWWVAAGPGVAAHATATLRARDVAPTLAAWLGVPPPAQAEGRTALGLVDAVPVALERLRQQDEERLAALAPLRSAEVRARLTARDHARWLRAALVLLLYGALLGWLRRRLGALARGGTASALALTVSAGAFFLLWGPPSFSAAPVPGLIAVRSALLFLLCAAVLLPWCLRHEEEPGRSAAALLGAAGVSALPAAIVFVLEGAFSKRALLPDPVLAALPLQVWPVAGSGALLGLVALGLLTSPVAAWLRPARRSDLRGRTPPPGPGGEPSTTERG